MADRQQQLIDKARRIDHGLKKYRYPRGQLPTTIEIMEELKHDLEEGTVSLTAGHRQKIVLSNLRELKELVSKHKEVRRDLSALLPKELRDEIAASLHENVPEEYRQMVDNYFRALSEVGSSR